jgi:DNA (cytosine-5)-methyltransferase 1
MSLLPTKGTGSGSWPTPTVDDSSNVTRKSGKFQSLTRKVMFPTPQANEDAAGTPNGKMQRMLGNCEEIRGKTAQEWAGGTLNPNWVEWLMGWPIGWTDLKPLEMGKFQRWLDLHGMS